jgi:polar amino acid transport system substrate-binding protein
VNRSARAAGLLAASALVLAGCGGGDEAEVSAPTAEPSAGPSAAAGGGDCSPESLETLEEGTLTIGTDSPAFEPWFSDDDPTNGQGFESAVAYAVAEQLGYAEGDVTWTVAAFNSIISPAEKPFDLAINQVSITDERRQAVDFTSGYYTAAQTVITVAGSPIDGATTLADLKGAKLGAQVGTTSLQAIEDVVQPDEEPGVFDTNDVAKTQLQNGQVDGIVVDLPTAFYITAAELEDGVIVGQLPAVDGAEQDEFGMVLDKDSPLTDCATQAVDALREDGTLAALEEEYLAGAGAPVLE